MTSIEGGSEILKSDKRGRVWRSPDQRQRLLEEFDRSGLSGIKFAELTGVKYQTLAAWLHNRRKQRGQMTPVPNVGSGTPVQWFETVIDKTPSAANSALIIRLPSGAAIEVTTPSHAPLAGAVLRAWEKTLC